MEKGRGKLQPHNIKQNMETTVRLITFDDANQIFHNLLVKSDLDSVTEGLAKDIEKMKLGEFVKCVAVCDKNVVGQAEFKISETPIRKHLVKVSGMVVMESYQGIGTSSKLLEFGTEWAKSNNAKMAILSVRKGTKAEKIYKHWGFEVYGELRGGIVEPWEDGKAYDEVLMYKKL